MDRIACIHLPEFPLQLLLQSHSEWQALPAVVVDRDKAQGVILYANDHARSVRILPGMRYAAALSLTSQLRAGEVPESDITTNVDAVTDRLRFYSAAIEPSEEEPGVFWADASGLSLLYPSLLRWAQLIANDLSSAGFDASVIVGYSRFGTRAVAGAVAGATKLSTRSRTRHTLWPGQAPPRPELRYPRLAAPAEGGKPKEVELRAGGERLMRPAASDHVYVFNAPDAERTAVRRVPIDRLGIAPDVRDKLSKLGITRVGAFLDLPANSVRKRLGADTHRLHRLAHNDLFAPLVPQPPREPIVASVHLDTPESNLERVMAVVEMHLQSLLRQLGARSEVIAAIHIRLAFDDDTHSAQRLAPATPTLETAQIVDLLKLRLGSLKLSAGITGIDMEIEGTPAERRQGELFVEKSPRDLAAAARAFARLRAELGEHSVVYAVLREAHLPEARYEWQPAQSLAPPKARGVRIPSLVRRIYAHPVAFSPAHRRDADRMFRNHIDDGTVRETFGPYIVSGGWWQRDVQREYYFVRTTNGRALWMYFDRRRQGWYLHGEVE